MGDPDEALERFRLIIAEFSAFCKSRGGASEADTRAKVIDKIVTEVLLWPEKELSREDRVESGWIDYTLSLHGQPYLALEAKKEGKSFTLPHKVGDRRYSLDGALVTNQEIKKAIVQVRQYCDDADIPIKYAIATNGYTWIIFRAIREDISWRKGRARVFPSLEFIHENFTEFWNLLSFSRIESGSLQEEFMESDKPTRKMLRVIDKLFNADLPLRRNRLNTPLQPLISLIFEDIADQDQIEILQSCYVHTGSIKIVQNDLDEIITLSIPHFLVEENTKPVGHPDTDEGFEHSIASIFGTNTGRLFLLLGGIGSGKTTFLKRYQRTTGREMLIKQSFWFAIDFLRAPNDPTEMEKFVWQSILDDLRKKYRDKHPEKIKTLKIIFSDKISVLESNILNGIKPSSPRFGEVLGPYILDWQGDLANYVPSLLKKCCQDFKLKPVLFIDNVDQLSPDYQGQIFLLAQRVTRILESITVVSLREESYYTASIQRKFSAYANHKFHIASPRFRTMIASRIEYAIRLLGQRKNDEMGTILSQDYQSVADFLLIVRDSIFGQNKNIIRFIEAICYGNMRLALQLFTTFLTSGATNADKMTRIYNRDGYYNVPYHEFVKSIMLGDRHYYKEDHSPVLNVFNVGPEKNSSHFSILRLLSILQERRGESSSEGNGYISLSSVIGLFENVFNNRGDVIKSLNKLVKRQLIEANTRSTESVDGASHIRVTSSGIYYLSSLSKSFPYLDLVLQDTPLNDESVEHYLRQSVFDVDNLSDREDVKLERVRARFERVERFLIYLKAEEDFERLEFGLVDTGHIFSKRFVSDIQRVFHQERKRIDKRITINREKYGDSQHTEETIENYDIIVDIDLDSEIIE